MRHAELTRTHAARYDVHMGTNDDMENENLVQCERCEDYVHESDLVEVEYDRDGAPYDEDTYPECEDPAP